MYSSIFSSRFKGYFDTLSKSKLNEFVWSQMEKYLPTTVFHIIFYRNIEQDEEELI